MEQLIWITLLTIPASYVIAFRITKNRATALSFMVNVSMFVALYWAVIILIRLIGA